VSIFNHVTPSERIADLELNVRRIRKQTGLDVVQSWLSRAALARGAWPAQSLGSQQIFAAGTRGLVEQMLMQLRGRLDQSFQCVYLIDCDGQGKTQHLKERSDLIVTETCDLEADLVHLGVATRVVAPYCASGTSETQLVDLACQSAMP
jgi:hypothetical protein